MAPFNQAMEKRNARGNSRSGWGPGGGGGGGGGGGRGGGSGGPNRRIGRVVNTMDCNIPGGG